MKTRLMLKKELAHTVATRTPEETIVIKGRGIAMVGGQLVERVIERETSERELEIESEIQTLKLSANCVSGSFKKVANHNQSGNVTPTMTSLLRTNKH